MNTIHPFFPILQNKKYILLLIFFLALVFRIIAVDQMRPPVEKDALMYHKIALNIMSGHGHADEPGKPTALRQPLYPFFLSIFYRIFGAVPLYVLYFQAFLNSFLVIPIFLFAYRISDNWKLGILAASFFAFHTSFEIVSRLYRENIVIVLLLFYLFFLYEGNRRSKPAYFIASGVIGGLLGLTNRIFIPMGFFVLFIGFLWIRNRKLHKFLLIHALISFIVVVPWLLRNQMLPKTANDVQAGRMLIGSHYPAFTDKWWWPVVNMEALERTRDEGKIFFQKNNDITMDDLLHKIIASPFNYLKLVLSRILILWVSPPVGTTVFKNVHPLIAFLTLIVNYVFVVIAVLSTIIISRSDKMLFIIPTYYIYMTLVYGFIHSIRRYGYPLVPEICIFSALGIGYIYQLSHQKLTVFHKT